MKFYEWLFLQKGREDPVGELARNYFSDQVGGFPKSSQLEGIREMDIREWMDYLSSQCPANVEEKVINALMVAWEEYIQTQNISGVVDYLLTQTNLEFKLRDGSIGVECKYQDLGEISVMQYLKMHFEGKGDQFVNMIFSNDI